MRPINIYSLSRIQETNTFNIVVKHSTQCDAAKQVQPHEMESLRLFADALISDKVPISQMGGFFYGFQIAQIGKEFDLLKFTDKFCLNVELKSEAIPEAKIITQLRKNRYYLGHLGKRILLYTVITDTMTCYRLTLNDELMIVPFSEVAGAIKTIPADYIETIDNKFRVSDYLVSPLNTPDRFIQGEYFLTLIQDQIKNTILSEIDKTILTSFFHLTGKPGTGKTLLLYDIAKTLSKSGRTLIIHCGKLSAGQEKLNEEVANLDIISVSELRDNYPLSEYCNVLVDEAHRIYADQFKTIVDSANDNDQVCIFSSDPEQILSLAEKKTDIVAKIKALPLTGEYRLSDKVRTNKELISFIMRIQNLKHRPKTHMKYEHVELNYANTTEEAQLLLKYYRSKGYVFINYSKSYYETSPYSVYEEDFDTHHVLGQEFDKVVMLMDASFYYDENDMLQGIEHPNPDYLYPNLFYQGVTRVREQLALVIVDAPVLFEKIVSVIATEPDP